ncbi:vanadium-dependent haloperoxidase [Paradesertivirga mongoliensis]|uniref:Vanadium-dependent haloperoxidase n=1 Tax=Paradesertivirga mongoliensis TaxID=2100740 RepID=A0ABW4ZRM0_9SPHI|nr:vanadium-dependent haloperoxidase [Pedobacter mongoliensis]
MKSKSLVLLSLLFICSCQKKEYKKVLHDPRLFSETVKELNHVVMDNSFSPVVASRNYAYAAIAAYEVIAAGLPEKYQTLQGQLKDLDSLPNLKEKHKVDIEYAALLAFCSVGQAVTFPEGSMKLYVDSVKQLAADHEMPEDVKSQSEDFASQISKAIINWSKGDNYLKTRAAEKYIVTNNDGYWAPTPPMYGDAMEPHWNQIRPFVLDSADQLRAPKPLEFNMKDTSSAYYKEVMMLKRASENLTEDQKHMALFWDDNPLKMNVYGHAQFSSKKFSPPAHWMSITGIAAEKAKFNYAETVYAFAKVSIALFDAFIQCWDSKFTYSTARPETVINKFIDKNWTPLLQTPPFPEYTCGHSTISSSAGEVLTEIYGDNFAFTDTTEREFGIKDRSFKSFRAAAEENNWARFYGGIHFHQSCLVSTDLGRKVGQMVVAKLKMKR